MKNLLLVLVMVFGFSGSALADVKFQDWTVVDGGNSMLSPFYEKDGFATYWQVYNDGAIFMKVNGDIVVEDGLVVNVSVNNQWVKMEVSQQKWGATFTPVTKRGREYISNQLWSASRITVFIQGAEEGVYWSARGIQKAWRYMQRIKAI